MIEIKNYPVEISYNTFCKSPNECDPVLYLLLSLSSCVARHLRKFYKEEEVETDIMRVIVEKDYSLEEDVIIINLYLDKENFNFGINFLTDLMENCYISNTINLKQKFVLYVDNKIIEVRTKNGDFV